MLKFFGAELYSRHIHCFIIGTDVKLTAWVTELMTGIPVNRATVSVLNKKNETNHQGLCTIAKYKSENDEGGNTANEILIVQIDDDRCILTDIYFLKYSNRVFSVMEDLFREIVKFYKQSRPVSTLLKGLIRWLVHIHYNPKAITKTEYSTLILNKREPVLRCMIIRVRYSVFVIAFGL